MEQLDTVLQEGGSGLVITDEELERRKTFLDITDEDLKRVRELSGMMKEVSGPLFEGFFGHLTKFPELVSILGDRADYVKKSVGHYVDQLFAGRIDREYVETRIRVGRTHERIGLAPKWYLGAFCLLQRATHKAMQATETGKKDPARLLDSSLSLAKLLFFDMAITIDVFIASLNDTIHRAQQEALRELSAPVIEVWDEVLVLPLIGTMDTRRAHEISETLLPAVVEKRARVVILDITGLPVMDTSTANYLFKAVRAVELLGATAIMTGVKPAIAQTMVGLGIDTGALRTRARLADGLKFAFELTGRTVTEKRGRQQVMEQRSVAQAKSSNEG